MNRLKRRAERGGAAAVVAVLLAGGVLLGASALAVDVGNMMFERRQLQNGADAAAVAMAKLCAQDASYAGCNDNNATLAGVNALNSANASDGQAALGVRSDATKGVCGGGPAAITNGGNLPDCDSMNSSAAVGDILKCPPLPDFIKNEPKYPYVEVYSQTGTTNASDGGTPGALGSFLQSDQQTPVGACARAYWGKPGPHTATTPVTFSLCEFDALIAKNLDTYLPPQGASPGYDGVGANSIPDWPAANYEQGVILQGTGKGKTPIEECTTSNGHDTAGGFGYLTGDGCTAEVTDDDWVQGETGNNAKDCDMSKFWKTVIEVPVYDCMAEGSSPKPSGAPSGDCEGYDAADPSSGNGSKNWYHIAGWAQFYLSGYATGGAGSSAEASVNPNTKATCKTYSASGGGSSRCLIGWFVSGTLLGEPTAPPGDGVDFQTYSIALAG